MKMNKWWVYTIKTPNGMVYVGQSKSKYSLLRWQPIHYEHTTLAPYIEEFGWDNLIKEVVKDGIETLEEATKLETDLILFYKENGVCINKNKTYHPFDSNTYMKIWYEENKGKRKYYYEKYKDKIKERYEKNKDKIKEYTKQYYEENKDSIKDKQKEWRENNKDYQSLYYQNHKEQNRERQRRYQERKRLKKQTTPDGCIPLF